MQGATPAANSKVTPTGRDVKWSSGRAVERSSGRAVERSSGRAVERYTMILILLSVFLFSLHKVIPAFCQKRRIVGVSFFFT